MRRQAQAAPDTIVSPVRCLLDLPCICVTVRDRARRTVGRAGIARPPESLACHAAHFWVVVLRTRRAGRHRQELAGSALMSCPSPRCPAPAAPTAGWFGTPAPSAALRRKREPRHRCRSRPPTHQPAVEHILSTASPWWTPGLGRGQRNKAFVGTHCIAAVTFIVVGDRPVEPGLGVLRVDGQSPVEASESFLPTPQTRRG